MLRDKTHTLALLAGLTLALTVPGVALAQTPAPTPPTGTTAPTAAPAVEGEWLVHGSRRQSSTFRGRVTFTAKAGGGWTYQLQMIHASGDTEQQVGDASLTNGQLVLVGRRVTSAGLAGALAGTTAPKPEDVRRAWLDPRAGVEVYEGPFEQAGDPWLGGWLRLEKQRPDNSSIELLVNGSAGFPAIRQAINDATESIHIETYLWENDSTGQWMAQACIDAARRGVKVRILMDRIGGRDAKPLVKLMEAAGCEVNRNNPILREGLPNLFKDAGRGVWYGLGGLLGLSSRKPRWERRTVLNRDHSKVMVMDGKVGFIGSMNISEDHEFHYRDVHSRVKGVIVHELQRHFLDRWQASGQTLPADLTPLFKPVTANHGTLDAKPRRHIPGLGNEIKAMYLTRLGAVQRHFHAENAYLLDTDIIEAMKTAAGRGVDVRVILPNDEKHRVKLVRDAFNWVRDDVIAAGVRLYKLRGRMVHSKVATADGDWSTIGSSNLDPTSTKHNIEFNLEIRGSDFAGRLTAQVFTPDFAASDVVGRVNQPWYRDLWSGALHLFRGFL